MAPRQVQVELYIDSRGPEHTFQAPLVGWDQDRLDLAQIMQEYKLQAIYAYSFGSGRGQRLLQNPRNGLSLVAYSGKADSVVRLDGDPKASLLAPIVKSIVGLSFIVAMLACLFGAFPQQWIEVLRNASMGKLLWLVCFITMIVMQVIRHSKPRRKVRL